MNKLLCQVQAATQKSPDDWDCYILPLLVQKTRAINAKDLNTLPQAYARIAMDHVNYLKLKAAPDKHFALDLAPGKKLLIQCVDGSQSMFERLSQTRKASACLEGLPWKKILIQLSFCPDELSEQLADAWTSRLEAMNFITPKRTQKKPTEKAITRKMLMLTASEVSKQVRERATRAQALTRATNLARLFVLTPGSHLTPKDLRKRAEAEAQKRGLSAKFISQAQLKKQKAGAFLAVAQGSAHQDAGILHLRYQSKAKKAKKLVLVGKGITYDTGGVNLKPPAYMFGMHQDMAGSAAALAVIAAAHELQWPVHVDCYLAIADNAIGERAYRPNDVVTSLSGKTIEVVHTDAEGRMVLADTLTLAAKSKPDLILDYATLTGACVGAIGTTYTGAFTNRVAFHDKLLEAGRYSGERLWTFPIDEDFAKPLESDIADIKQCRLKGGVDHIEAACFLKSFLVEDIPWVHFDLSSGENSGGLAHIDTDATGVGVRFTEAFLRKTLWPD